MKYFVSCQAAPGGSGTEAHPFQTISEAARIALPGDEVLVQPGVYREWVNPAHAGTEEARLVYRSAVPRAAVITGAERVAGWTRMPGTNTCW